MTLGDQPDIKDLSWTEGPPAWNRLPALTYGEDSSSGGTRSYVTALEIVVGFPTEGL